MRNTIGMLGALAAMYSDLEFPIYSNYKSSFVSASTSKRQRGKVVYNGHDPYHRMKLGRNILCPCGSGKKNKKCHNFTHITKR